MCDKQYILLIFFSLNTEEPLLYGHPPFFLNNLVQKHNHCVCTVDIVVYKVPMDCIFRHSVISDTMRKAAGLSDFDNVLIAMLRDWKRRYCKLRVCRAVLV